MFMKIIFISSVIILAAADEFIESEDQYDLNINPPKEEYKNQYESNNEYQPTSEYNNNKKPSKTDYENQYKSSNKYQPKSGYKPKKVVCLDIDVTKQCKNRADGNYAIDNKPRAGYIACVNKSPICMPCPYGLTFCAKTGYKGLGHCLGEYDECPSRSY
ncbi:periculin-1 precursor [Hydra vulgaris]|uniref:Periculin 1a n=1 Tax=Hydra vulgaris TaxID=6087 RepID=C1JCM0_HYDVU|nr:periculin-1 precursor [Hydra vulgaris]ACO55941.1 periculin 1a [Hydra vulgaris]